MYLEPADPSVFGCAPFHGDACEGDHGELGDVPLDVLVAMAHDAYPDKTRQRGHLRRLMRDHGMLPARPLRMTDADRLRELALDDPAVGAACERRRQLEAAAASAA